MNGYYDENGRWVSLDAVTVGDPNLDQIDPDLQKVREDGVIPGVPSTYRSSFDWSKVGDWAKTFLSGKGSAADYGTAIAGLMGLYEYMNRDRSPKSWEGKVQKGTYVPPTVSPSYYQGIMGRKYGERAMGANPFTGGRYIAPPAPPASAAPPATTTPPTTTQPYDPYKDPKVAEGFNDPNFKWWDIKDYSPSRDPRNPRPWESFAYIPESSGPSTDIKDWHIDPKTGYWQQKQPTTTSPVAPAPVAPAPVAAAPTSSWKDPFDVLSSTLSPLKYRSSAGMGIGGGGYPYISEMYFAKGGALPPRYLRGETDGMADKLPSSIDGQQPAKLSHGEFVVPADVVSHLGNGNSDAGAKVLYKMMDRVRQARTGTKRQGKQIKPEKFMPGGIANIPRYAGGGAVAFNNGGTATAGTTAGGLAPWVGDYVAGSEGFLSKAWALGDQPYQAYQGPLTAGVSPLQEQAFTGIQSLGTPSQFGTATSLAEKAGQAAGNLSYSPSGLPAYDKVTSGYNAPTPYQFGQFSSGLGPVKSVQDYMTPYMTGVTDIEAREARRQADIARQTEQSRLAQAGAYGGSRQAIMEAERQRNLGQQIGDITTKGLQSAYDRALTQRLKEAELGFEAQKATEASRQYGATQGMTAAELAAKFGQSAQTSNQAAALKAAEQQEASRQFGANLGLRGIEQQLASASQLGALGAKEFETQLQGLDALSRAGATQQQAEQAAVDAQLRQFQEAQQWPYKQLEFQRGLLSGLPVGTQTVTPTTSGFNDLIGGIGELLRLRGLLGG